MSTRPIDLQYDGSPFDSEALFELEQGERSAPFEALGAASPRVPGILDLLHRSWPELSPRARRYVERATLRHAAEQRRGGRRADAEDVSLDDFEDDEQDQPRVEWDSPPRREPEPLCHGTVGFGEPRQYVRLALKLRRDPESPTRDDVLGFRPLCDKSPQQRDVKKNFRIAAVRFMYAIGAGADSIYTVDNGEPARPVSDSDRRGQVARAFEERSQRAPKLGVVAFFCHGWPTGMQLGFNAARPHAPETISELARLIGAAGTRDVRVILYACQTGASSEEGSIENLRASISRQGRARREYTSSERSRLAAWEEIVARQMLGANSFAFLLRDALIATNPGCSVFAHSTLGDATRNPYARIFDGGVGVPGRWIIPPDRRSAIWGAWVSTMKGASTLRYRFPFMTAAEIAAELAR